MRVLHLINAFNPGGVERWLLSMLEELPRDVCEMDVCCKGENTGPWAPQAERLGATIFHCPLRWSHVGFLRGVARILRNGRYDLVHNHLGVYSGCGTWVARREGIPVLVTFHNTEFRPTAQCFRFALLRKIREEYGRVSIRYALAASHLITCVSRGVCEHIVPKTSEMLSKSRILFHGVSLPELPDREQRAAFRKGFGWPPDTPVAIHVGKFTEQKNHVGLLEVFDRVLKQLPEAKLILIGVGPLKDRVERAIEERGLGEAVIALGARSDALELVSHCDVFLFPSLFEGFGLAALEANAAGLPAVGTRILGLLEAVEDGRTAKLHDVLDTEGMADSVVRILTDHEYARELGNAGRARAEKLFSRARSAERLLELYNECLTMARA